MKFLKGLGKGIGFGFLAAPALYAMAFVLEFLNCFTCGMCSKMFSGRGPNYIPTCMEAFTNQEGGGLFPIWNLGYFVNTTIFLVIAGMVVGIIYGIATQIQENERAKRDAQERDRQAKEAAEIDKKYAELKYAYEFKNNARNIIEKCNSNRENSENVVPCPKYNGISLQEKLWLTQNKVSIPMQKLEDIVAELASKTKEEK